MSNADLTLYDGTSEVPVALSRWDGTSEIPFESVGIMPWGYPSVADMQAHDPFYVAHRGGSAVWPEGSMRAYTRSVAWGAGALEAPLARTSDGVWFVLHDQNLNRTSQTTGLPNANTMTWAQVQAYKITLNGGNEDYLRLVDLLDIYSESHVLFIDPKYRLAEASELFGIVKSYPGWQKHVMKYFFDATSFAASARTAGFTTWGYYYEGDISQIDATHSYWDLLGMDYNASQAAWDAILAPGKPVIGHIVPSATAATTALSKGASGLMVSGVTSVVPFTGV